MTKPLEELFDEWMAIEDELAAVGVEVENTVLNSSKVSEENKRRIQECVQQRKETSMKQEMVRLLRDVLSEDFRPLIEDFIEEAQRNVEEMEEVLGTTVSLLELSEDSTIN